MLHESFAHRIASQWNVQQSGIGYVLRFKVRKEYVDPMPVYIIGGPEHREYRIPAEEIEELNRNIVGSIEVLATYHDNNSEWQQAIAWA